MLETSKCPVRVVWVCRKTRWVALFTTNLHVLPTLSTHKLHKAWLECKYGWRWAALLVNVEETQR